MKITVFPNEQGQWFWHVTSRNGKILADGSEGYTRKASAERAAHSFRTLMKGGDAAVVVLDADPRIARAEKKAAKAAPAKKAPVKKAVAKKAPAKKAAAKKAPAKKK